MSQQSKKTIAIDFGTTNTFVSRCPQDSIQSSALVFETEQMGLESSILYRQGQKNVIGSQASQIWGNATLDERRKMELMLAFKPELHVSAKAAQASKDFLKGILDYAQKDNIPMQGAHLDTFIGAPSKSSPEFKEALKEIASAAGFSNLSIKDEAIGALLYHVAQKDISPAEARAGVLIVDFGGGTCDFALMQDLNIIESYGDNFLGGRLFDDLFYQWFLAENPRAATLIKQDQAEFFVHFRRCRELKENFSIFMSRHRQESFSARIPYYGELKNITWDDFIVRAKNYQPSQQLLNYLGNHSRNSHFLFQQKELNLLNWFLDLLKESTKKATAINKVILCGGSSMWPFVKDLIKAEFALEDQNIIRSDNPYSVISQGLSMLKALENKMKQATTALKDDFPLFMTATIQEDILLANLQKLKARISNKIVAFLIEEKIRPQLLEYRDQGGSIKDLENKLSQIIETTKAQCQEITLTETKKTMRIIEANLKQAVKNWLHLKGGVKAIELADEDSSLGLAKELQLKKLDLYKESVLIDLEKIVNSISAVIGATILSGLEILFLSGGPLSWLIGAVVGGGASIYGLAKSRAKIKEIKLHRKITGVIFADKMLERTLRTLSKKMVLDVEHNLKINFEKTQDKLVKQIEQLLANEIDSISKLSLL